MTGWVSERLFGHTFWLVLMQALLGLVAVFFGIAASTGGLPMTPDDYGVAIYTIPAETWAFVVFASTATIILGVVQKSAPVTFFGGASGALIYAGFFVMAYTAESGDLVVHFCVGLFLPWHSIITVFAFLVWVSGNGRE